VKNGVAIGQKFVHSDEEKFCCCTEKRIIEDKTYY